MPVDHACLACVLQACVVRSLAPLGMTPLNARRRHDYIGRLRCVFFIIIVIIRIPIIDIGARPDFRQVVLL